MGLGRVLLPTPARPGYGRTPKSVQLCREAEAAAACLTPVHLSSLLSLLSPPGAVLFVQADFFCLGFLSCSFLIAAFCPVHAVQRCKSVPSSWSISSSLLAASKCHFISGGLSLLQLLTPLFLDSLFTPSPCSLPVTLSLPLPASLYISVTLSASFLTYCRRSAWVRNEPSSLAHNLGMGWSISGK